MKATEGAVSRGILPENCNQPDTPRRDILGGDSFCMKPIRPGFAMTGGKQRSRLFRPALPTKNPLRIPGIRRPWLLFPGWWNALEFPLYCLACAAAVGAGHCPVAANGHRQRRPCTARPRRQRRPSIRREFCGFEEISRFNLWRLISCSVRQQQRGLIVTLVGWLPRVFRKRRIWRL